MFPPKQVIYDDPSDFICEQTSRQVGKSTDLAALQVGYTTAIPNFSTLFIAPRSRHKSDFSHQRLSPIIKNSPFIAKNFVSYRLVDNVDLKQFTNGSSIMLKHAFLSDLPLRGPTSDLNLWDEYQDQNPAIFGIGQETLNRSLYKKTVVAGTPKTSITPLAKVWESSTKYEVMYKCTGCGYWNLPSLAHVKPHGPACEKCDKILTPDKWEWVVTGDPTSSTSGYHYNKLGLAIFRDPATNWKKDVWNKLYGSDEVRKTLREFKNEVLGESDDESVRPIVMQDIKECCNPSLGNMSLDQLENAAKNDPYFRRNFYAAIDWGTTNTSTSNTVIVVGTLDPKTVGKIKVVLIKRFIGEDSNYDFIMNYIFRLCSILPTLKFLGADNGMGAAQNSMIRNRLGFERLFGFQFVGNQKDKTKWHSVIGSTQEEINAYFTVSKTVAFDQFFYEIKEELWEFPNWQDFQEFGQEILNVEQKFNEDKDKYIYTHALENPDDSATALIYLRLLMELSVGL